MVGISVATAADLAPDAPLPRIGHDARVGQCMNRWAASVTDRTPSSYIGFPGTAGSGLRTSRATPAGGHCGATADAGETRLALLDPARQLHPGVGEPAEGAWRGELQLTRRQTMAVESVTNIVPPQPSTQASKPASPARGDRNAIPRAWSETVGRTARWIAGRDAEESIETFLERDARLQLVVGPKRSSRLRASST